MLCPRYSDYKILPHMDSIKLLRSIIHVENLGSQELWLVWLGGLIHICMLLGLIDTRIVVVATHSAEASGCTTNTVQLLQV